MLNKLVRRNVAATKGRLFLMLLSIVLGVSFVSGSFLLADSLRDVFGQITETAFAGLDGQVRAAENELSSGVELRRFSDELVAEIETLPQVDEVEPNLAAAFQVFTVAEDGSNNRPTGPPVFASSWKGPSQLSPFTLADGTAPVGNQIAIDSVQAERHSLAVGDQTRVSGPGLENFLDVTVSGIVNFGETDALGGAYFNLFDLDTMQQLLDEDGMIDGIGLARANGVSVSDMLAAVEGVIDPELGLEVVTGATVASEQSSDFNEIIDILGYVLLGFALVVLFVSIFIIYNTFAILISQRIRQFGLLRSIGVTGQQLTRMVVVEALFIGLLASLIGLVGGIGIAELLKLLFAAGGGEFPDGRIIFKPRTVLIVFGLGVGVTVASALLPAQIAQRISPLAALRDGAAAQSGSRTRRVLVGTLLTIAGTALLGAGLFLDLGTAPRLVSLGIGAMMLFVGVAALSVLFASVVTRAIGRPVEALRGLNGRVARDNASRNPQRTAATATALMIGLALITGVLVLTASLQASFNKVLDEAVAADLFLYDDNQGFPFSARAVDRLNELDEIGDTAGVSTLRVDLDGEVVSASGFDLSTQDRVIDIGLSQGTFDAGANGVLVYGERAEELGLGLGDQVTFGFEDGAFEDFSIVGVFDDSNILDGNWIFDRTVTSQRQSQDTVQFIGATIANGVDPAAGQAAAEAAVASFPQLAVENNAEFKATQEGQINSILYLVFGLLALCILVAFIGIVNTMALSILERTREIGLLRAVGTKRSQLRPMVRWEAVIVGIFGAMLGVVLGLVIGIAAVSAIPDSFVSEISIPWIWALVFMVLGGLLGVTAAFFPAQRAAKMNILDAIASM